MCNTLISSFVALFHFTDHQVTSVHHTYPVYNTAEFTSIKNNKNNNNVHTEKNKLFHTCRSLRGQVEPHPFSKADSALVCPSVGRTPVRLSHQRPPVFPQEQSGTRLGELEHKQHSLLNALIMSFYRRSYIIYRGYNCFILTSQYFYNCLLYQDQFIINCSVSKQQLFSVVRPLINVKLCFLYWR